VSAGSPLSSPAKRSLPVAVLLLLALFLRLHGIGSEALWTDEVFSAEFSAQPVPQLMRATAMDSHPPLYYMGLRFWRMIARGTSETGMRLYSVLWSLIGLWAVFLLARDLGGGRVGLVALFLGAVNPLDVFFAQEARMYAQTTALCALGSWCLWRWVRALDGAAERKDIGRWWVYYTLCAATALLTHYLAVFPLVSQGLCMLAWCGGRRQWRNILLFVGSVLTVALVFLPWFSLVVGVRGALYNPLLAWIPRAPVSDYVLFAGREFFWGWIRQVPSALLVVTLSMAALVLAAGARRALQSGGAPPLPMNPPHPAGILFLFSLLFLPLLLVAIAGRVYHPLYVAERFSLFVLPPFLVLASIACLSLASRLRARIAAALIGIVMLAATLVQERTVEKSDWRAFARIWREEGPPALVVFFPSFYERAASYYLGRQVRSAPRSAVETLLPQLGGEEVWVYSAKDYVEREYFEWLASLGEKRSESLPAGLELVRIRIPRAGAPRDAGSPPDQATAPDRRQEP